MGLDKSAVIPIASLSAIVAICLVFVVWWFPRQWARGNAQDRQIMDQEIQQRDAYLANLRAQQAVNRAEGDEETGSLPPSETAEVKPPVYVAQPPKGYTPPVTMY